METIEAVVEEVDEKHFIRIGGGDDTIRIPISEDKPKEVKKAFNKLIVRLRDGVFKVELVDVGEDLFSQVAEEYVKQLNREIGEVFESMKEHDLLEG